MKPGNVESIYRLSPVQEGILFHALNEPESGLYVRHLVIELSGALAVERLQEAWTLLLARHAVLRTSFHWQEVAHPVQVVARKVVLPWEEKDWRCLSSEERQRSMTELLRADLARGFDLAQPPLVRLTLVRTGESSWELVWTFHHLILDGWSLLLLLRELFSVYAELCRGGRPVTAKVVPFKEFITWQERRSDRDGADAERFWRRSLAGFSAPTPLPGVRPLAAGSGERRSYEERGTELSVEMTAALLGLAKRHGLTANTLVQGAWAALLSRTSQAQSNQNNDVVFGTTVSGRSAPLPGIESMVGLLINTLPLRVRAPDRVALLPWLRDLQESASELLQHEHDPLASIQGWSEVPRGSALFDSIVVFQNLPIEKVLDQDFVGSLPLRIGIRRGAETLNYPLALIVFEGERLALRLSFERERVEPAAAVRTLGHLRSLLEGMAELSAIDQGATLADLPLLSAAERQQLLLEWNSGPAVVPVSGSLWSRFSAVAAERPEAVAVIGDRSDEAQLTYGELAARSRALASWLRRSGVVPGERVGLRLERSPEMVVGILGVLAAGAAYVPLDPASPEERLSFILDDSGARIVVRPADFSAAAAAREPGGEVKLGPDDLAYLIYTSGSTGRPKGVGVTHGNVLSLLGATASGFGLGPDDVWTLFHSYAFDFSVWELWGALAFGGRLVVVPWAVSRTPEAFRELLIREGVTVLNQTPSAFGQLVGTEETAEDLSSLRLVIFGGEALEPRLLLPWIDHYGDERPRLINMYGITETTVHVTERRLVRSDLGAGSRIGRPLAGWAVYLLAGSLEPVPAGCIGEMFVGGAGVSQGYPGRPELTAERFVPDPFGGSLGARLYRSGDLARHLLDGDLEYLGRIDHQVKVRGFRIELGEIEAALAEAAGVAEAAVVLRRDLAGGDGLVGYVVAEPGAALSGAALREHLKTLLPDYMVPAQVVLLEALPLTTNGKLDRRWLAEQAQIFNELGVPASERTSRSLRTQSEELLAGIFCQVLKVEQVGAGSDFFALGGHSLFATQLLSRVREAFQVELPMRAIFEHPTVAGLAREIVEASSSGGVGGSAPPPIERTDWTDLPLSFAQQRLWFIDQLEGGSLYNLPAALRLSGELSIAVLSRVFTEVVLRHAVLRTVFRDAESGGEARQMILPPAGVVIPLVDLTPLAEGPRERLAARLVKEEARRPFDLARGPLLRVGLLRLDETEHVLLLTLHHIVGDAWSIGVLVREVTALYTVFAAGQPSPLPELPVQYADFAAWQRSWLAGEALQRELQYWRDHLAGAPPVLELPTDRPRPAVQSFRGAVRPLSLPPELSAALAALSRREGVTVFMTLVSALSALLSRFSGQADLTLGTPVAGRHRLEIESLIGFFVNTLVLRPDLSAEPRFIELLSRVRREALNAYAHQDLPFEKLVEDLAPERSLSQTPLFQVMFAWQNAALSALALPGLRLAPMELADEVAKFDLSLVLQEFGSGIAGSLTYAQDLFDAPTIDRLAAAFSVLLRAVVEEPELPVAQIPLLGAGERHQLLIEWNDTRAPFLSTTLLHQLFEAAVEKSPAAIAAVCAGRELTYAELETRSNRLAHLLRDVSVGCGAPVGVWVERSFDMLTAVLGILKAGGHYVALDEAWPAERVESILAATAAPALIAGSAQLARAEEMRWRLPALSDVVCLAFAEPEPPVEEVDAESVRELWDFVAERAVDRVTAGGFISAFTGLPFSEVEVDEYRDRVLSLAAPWLQPRARVLEIGNGSGLLLFELAARVAQVTGVDPSERTQERNRERAAQEGWSNVELLTGFAHELDDLIDLIDLIGEERFDLILLASTVQFFPGPRYLERVLRWALGRLAPGGAVLIADVLDARRQGELRRADGASKRQELFLDEDQFHGLGAAAVHHRHEGFPNELRFRYDVLLTAGEGVPRKRLWTGWHVERHLDRRLPAVAGPDDIAYVIHTSGSTGEPKGIVVQHRPAANLVDWINRTFSVGPEDHGLFITSLAFDLSVYDIFGLLAAGGTVHVANGEELGDPARLVSLLCAGGITLWDSAPAALVQLAPLFPATPDPANRLRRVLLSGDWIPVTLPDRVRQAFPGARVLALGGATEATVWSNWFPVEVVDPSWPSIPYGRPIANARYHVLDAAFSPSPVRIPGDLYIGGDCLCTGYARRPELTAAAFLPDPFAKTPGVRLYRTGDRARYGIDGNLEFLGRLDQQVKVRGYRIELGEIEVALARHPGVREAVVLVRQDEPGDQRLVAYVVASAEPALSPAELREALRQVLPEYMVPAAFVSLAEMPVTANGKLDRQALPAPARGEAASFVAPRTEGERMLAAIFAEVLGVERVGVEESFFDLGGHSLLATQVIARLRRACGIDIPLRKLFEHPTVASLAREIEKASPSEVSMVRVPRIDRTADLPLSFAQQRLWFIDRLEGGSLYNVPVALRMRGNLLVPVLTRVFAEVVRRHEILRTVFPDRNGRARQVILPPGDFALPVVDLTGLPPSPRAVAERSMTEEARRPFDLATGPLLRVGLWRLGAAEHLMLLALHHIVSDGWSLGVLVREVTALYTAFAAGKPSPLPELPVQYADFAAWQRSWLSGEVLDGELAWWRDHLSGAPPLLELPTDRPRPAAPGRKGGMLSLELGSELSAALSRLAQQQAATLFMVLLAAFESLLGRLAGAPEVCVGTPVAGRTQPETENLIGCFVNTLVLRGDLAGDPSFAEHLERVRREALAVFGHQELPFEKLVEELAPERSRGATPLFQVLLALQNAPLGPVELPGVSLEPLLLESGVTRFDLEMSFAETAAGLSAVVQYDAGLFDQTTIARLCGQLETVLRSAVASPERRLSELELLTAAERQQTLVEWRGVSGLSPEATVPARLWAQASRTPEALAVIWGEERLSHGELDRRVGRLAHRLRGLGVGPETRVGLLVERSPDLIVGLLAIWRAGGVAVPLDSGQPRARLALLAEDALAGKSVLVAQHGLVDLMADLPLAGVPVVWVDAEEEDEAEAEPAAVESRDLAYLIYTSGTTGRPKAVMVEHGSLAHTLAAVQEVFNFTGEDRMPVLASASFDIFLFELLAPLLAGGTAVLFSLQPTLDLALLAAELRSATLLHAVPAVMRQLTANALSQGVECPGLRRVFVGGDAVSAELLELMRRAFPRSRLTVLYGPTEGTILASCDEGDARAGNGLGRPLPGVTVEVRDGLGSAVPIGVAGELWLGGPGVARGYLGRPELTAERFVPDLVVCQRRSVGCAVRTRDGCGAHSAPYAECHFSVDGALAGVGRRLYRTGDRVRFTATGRLEFLGRVDQQVKIRGFRIEPGEVEAVLLACPGVREAVVLAQRQGADERLIAFVVAEGPLASAELRRFVEARLPAPMVPGQLVLLSALPLTRHGKVDRRALLDLAGEAGGEPPAASGAPRTPLEELVAGLFAELLHSGRVGPLDDFFELGGHSLLATQLVSRLREVLGVELPLRTLFEQPKVADLALRVEEALRSGTGPAAPPIRRVPRDGELPLSFAQQRLWFIDQLEGGALYNMPVALRMSGPLSVAVLSTVLAEVVRRHEALRTVFSGERGEARQVILPPAGFALPLVDLTDLAPALRQPVAERLVAEEALRPFDLARGPLVRAVLWRLDETEHAVLLTLHHVVSDGWSMAVLVREVMTLYTAFAAGRPSPLPELPVQYADFAAWQRSWLSGEVLERELRYWRERLAGAPPVFELPADRPRPAVPSFRGAMCPLSLSTEVSQALTALSRREGATLFMTLASAWSVLLSRFAGQADLTLGTPVAGRRHLEIESLIGFFVNTLVLRPDLSGTPRFTELLARVRREALDAYAHQDLPFEKLVEDLAPERSRNVTPLFQVMLAWQDVLLEELALPGLRLVPQELLGAVAKFDLSLTLHPSGERIEGSLSYARDLFDAPTINRLAAAFSVLLAAVAEDPALPVAQLPLLGPGERHQLLVEWNATDTPWPSGSTLPELFALQAAAHPRRLAWKYGEEELSYEELAVRSDAVARFLAQEGVGAGDVVGLCFKRSGALLISMVGILKARAAYLPLDPDYPPERLAWMLEDSGAPLVLTQESLDAQWKEISAAKGDPPGASPADPAYVIYTSGSTGRPKGVVVPHRAVVRLVLATDYVDLEGVGRIAQLSNLSFDAATFEIWGALLNGATLVGAPQETLLSPADLAAFLKAARIRVVFLTTALFNQIAQQAPGAFSAAQTVLFGGEAVDPGAVRKILAGGAPERLLHVYGPTENTTFSTWYQVEAIENVAANAVTVPIGRPIANTRAYVLDAGLQPVPVGGIGELYLGGEGLALGYQRQPERTAERFVESPALPGERLYRTGDRVRLLPDGNLEFRGRDDQQVKLRGFRIELGEIEAELTAVEGVTEAAVVLRNDLPGGRGLVAYVVGREDAELSPEALRRSLDERLPAYMVPSGFVQLPALPLTPNGKVDRRWLTERASVPATTGAARIAPRTAAEEILAGIFSSVLGLDQVGAEADFFALGGHSLLATQLVSRVRVAFGAELPLRSVFEHPTVAGLAREVETASRRGTASPPLTRVDRGEDLPLSFAQQRLWFIDQLEGGSLYNVPLALRLDGELSVAMLSRVLGEVVRRHEVLRTVFPGAGQQARQVILPPAAVTVPLVDLTGLAPALQPVAGELMREEARRPFDLARGPLLRVVLWRLGATEHLLLLVLHHIVSDGWSLGVLVREMTALSASQPSPLPELPVQYADFATWQRSWLAGDVLEGEIRYWRDHLAGAPPVFELPTDRPRPVVQSYRGAARALSLPAEVSQALTSLSRREGATLFMTLASAWSVLLSRFSGQIDFTLGTPVAGRRHLEIEGLIGFFVNTLVLRPDLSEKSSGEPRFTELLARMRREALDAYAHQDLPFEKLVETLAPERNLGAAPLFQVMFAVQNAMFPGAGELALPGLRLTPVELPDEVAKFDLGLALHESSDGINRINRIVGSLSYARDLFDAPTIDRLAAAFQVLLTAVVENPALPIAQLPLLGPGERHQLVVEWNATGTRWPADSTLPELFALQAAAHPHRLAWEMGGEKLRYEELAVRSDAVARFLMQEGVRAGDVVGVSFERSGALLVAMLGILKAGAAYLPLDPSYPRERLAWMLEDSGAPLVLTQESLDARWDEIAAAEGDPPGSSPADPAYVIYTSGSTGRPKGVVVPHRAVVRLVMATDYVDLTGLTDPQRIAHLSNLSFDAATFEIWGALLTGATLVGVPRETLLSPADLAAFLESARIQVLFLTTALFNQIAQQAPGAFGSLHSVLFGGEAVDPGAVRKVLSSGGPQRLLHVYGPTENTTFSTWYRVETVAAQAVTVPIGRPIANSTAHVLDAGLQPVPLGGVGELYLGGEGLALGYQRRPDLTAERFVESPALPGERLYRTGDLARRLPDGNIEFRGRRDQQVKLRGFRIELAEIELALTAIEGVAEAAVVLRDDLPGGRGLAAYVVGRDGAELSAEALRQTLEERLPGYMVPAGFVQLEALPLTPNGKVDRRWLAERAPVFRGTDTGGADRLAPRTAVEEILAGIFSSILGLDDIDEIGADADFFSLGGHSLLATQLVSRVREAFGVELPLRAAFEQPTTAGLAREIEKASRSAASAAAGITTREPGTVGLVLSFAQERLWFLQQLEPGSATYDMPLELELAGALSLDALAMALTGVLDRHEILRTTFVSSVESEGELCQRIAPPAPVTLPLVDLSALPEPVCQSAAEGLARWHAGWEFDLARGPLFVWLLVRQTRERHRLLLNLHHAISDGWSFQVLARELGELYAASVEGRPARLPELPIQYADFALWQRRWVAAMQEGELAYWESRLGAERGEAAAAELPTDRPRPAVQSFRGGRRQRVLGEELAARIKRFNRTESVTLFMTLLAALQALLARHSGEPDVAVGAPVAGRQWGETENLIGCFLNTLVLRTDTSGRPGFRELAARVRTVTLEAYSNQSVPFEAVLARLGVRRDLSRSPLFQVLINLLKLPATHLSLPGLELRSLSPAEAPSKFDMTFYIAETEAGIGINLVYNADLFDAAHMEDLLAQLELLLDTALERPDEPMADLPLVTAAMRQVLPDPALALDGSWIGSVHELFAATAARVPERAAVADGSGTRTYSGLLAASRRIAGWLAAHGVRQGDPVALLAVRMAPLVEAVLGTLGAGAAFVMVDAAYPALRQLDMLRQVAPRAWISFEEGAVPAEVRSWLCEAACPGLELPTSGALAVVELAPFAARAPEIHVGPQDVACIGFTSGSTGGPKGVLGLHGSLSHFLPFYCGQLGLGSDDRFSLLSGLGHDPLQREIFTALYLGGTIAVPDPLDFGVSDRLAAWLRREQVTVAHLTPTLGQLVTEPPADGMRETVPSLRRAILIGESLTRQDVARLRALAPGVSCINLYGATETQRALAFHLVTPEEAQEVLPLGRGMPDAQLLVLTPSGGLAGLGEIGEIAIRSPHLARGYLDNPELTAQRFQVNPLTGDPSDRIYRTGDLGRYRADGEVVFAGRLDQQVKVRGFRVELGEIEGVLAALPGVSEAVVLLRTDLPGGPGLVAYVRTEEGREASLRGALEARLPAYMVPAAFVRLDALPRNAHGKVDRQALSRIAPELGEPALRTLPRTPAEEILAGIWAQVLGREQIGAEQSFFELGGHSLLAAQMASRVRSVFGVELPLRSLFLTPTLAGLSAEIERLRGAPELPTITSFRRDRGTPPPLSLAQEHYWAGRHLEARSVASTIPMLMRLAGPLDRACLWRAIAAVVERHELLRTSFRDSPQGPIQVIHSAVPLAFPEVDLERLEAAERMAEVLRFSILDGRRHFDFERPPLFRATLFRCAAEEHLLLFTIHHVATDGWSNAILLGEVSALYLAFRAGRPSPLPPLAAQLQDFARWQRRLSAEEAQASQVTFWREHLSGAVPVDLRAGRPRSGTTFSAGTVEIRVPEELERRLDAVSMQQGATLFMTLLAAFKALLYSETGQDDLVVPCFFANRNQLETESLIGNLATHLPLRTRLAGVRTFRELLQQVRDVTLLAHDHPDIFWEPVVEGMSFLEEGDRGGLTTFRILFQLTKMLPVAPDQAASDLRVTRLPVDTGKIRLDLSLFLWQADRLYGRFRYNRDVLDEAQVIDLRDRYLRILAAVVDDPERPLAWNSATKVRDGVGS